MDLPIEKFVAYLDRQIEYFPYTQWECDFSIDPLIAKVNKISHNERARQHCYWSLRT